jgi:hypothetical protein
MATSPLFLKQILNDSLAEKYFFQTPHISKLIMLLVVNNQGIDKKVHGQLS